MDTEVLIDGGREQSMAWQVATARDAAALEDFLRAQEWRCVAFSSRVREARGPGRAESPGTILIRLERGSRRLDVREAIMLTRNGLVLPVLGPERRLALPARERPALIARRYRYRLHSIMGIRASVAKMEKWFGRRSHAHVDYNLMCLDFSRLQPEGPATPANVTIRRAFPEDTDLIFPLQRSYELEEVYLNPSYFDDRRCRSLLRRSLREQIVFVAEIRGEPVAKAGTNAQGFDADQIGGVFTVSPLRGTGLARAVMTALLQEIGRSKTYASLFVKKQNAAALRLYERLGFETREDYRITYYERF